MTAISSAQIAVSDSPVEEFSMSGKSASDYRINPTAKNLTVVRCHASEPRRSELEAQDAVMASLVDASQGR
jgi:hypothetical protein